MRHLLWDPKVYNRDQKSLPLDPALSIWIHSISSHAITSYFNIILPPTIMFSMKSFRFSLSDQNFVGI
jgi:hypothetical protein